MTQMNLRTLRLEVRAWLSENIPDDLSLPGPDEDITPELEAWTRDFRRKLGAKGWLAPSWPKHFGGGGFSPQSAAVITEEVSRRQLPPLGLEMVYLTPLRAWGTEEQKARWLTPILRGEISVSQIMSEPSTGTDLAHQDTKAIRDGDDFVVNGEKGYTGTPLTPDYLFILVTTDPNGERYKNLSTIIINARDPGVTISRRKILTGKSLRSFAFTDVRVPVVDVIGDEGGGWDVAQTLLDVEHGGKGVTIDQRRAIEAREREHWSKLPKPPV